MLVSHASLKLNKPHRRNAFRRPDPRLGWRSLDGNHYIEGCLEILEYTSFAAVSVLYVAGFATDYFEWDSDFQPLLWFLFYAFFIALLESKGKYVWWFMLLFVIPSLLPTILYVFSSIPYWDLRTNGALVDPDTNDTTWATGDIGSAFFALLPSTTVGYGGIESLTVATGFAKDPGYSVPKGTVAAVWTLFISNIALVLVTAALPPGLDETSSLFLRPRIKLGPWIFSSIVRVAHDSSPNNGHGIWMFYPICSTDPSNGRLEFIAVVSRNQRAKDNQASDDYVVDLWLFSLCRFVRESEIPSHASEHFDLAASICYASQTYGFVLLRTTYKIDTTGYKSPYGICGAYYVWLVSLCLFLSIAGGFQGDDGIAIVSTVVFLDVMTVYYRFGCQANQIVSQDEYASIFKFSVMKFNKEEIQPIVQRSKCQYDSKNANPNK
ncbi:hypothetical protein AC1031_012482 [Aphanomyces cochlioides]|nr:hypothetical protein AC1031_012482 [Aphanomyces cochlioides]